MPHLHAAGRLAVLHDLLELWAHETDLGDNTVDGHKLVQVMAAQGPWVEKLKQVRVRECSWSQAQKRAAHMRSHLTFETHVQLAQFCFRGASCLHIHKFRVFLMR